MPALLTTADSLQFVEIAAKSKAICDKYNVPLIINDRVDVALAVHASGVHVGQTDMPVGVVKRLLPVGSIVGVSCNNLDHVKTAIDDGVDYIGIGSVWATKTKSLKSPLVGVRGVGVLLDALEGTEIKAVAIGIPFETNYEWRAKATFTLGGIKSTNILRTLYGAVSQNGHTLDGVAVVSDIVASNDPQNAAANLSGIIHKFKGQGHLGPAMTSTPVSGKEVLKQALQIFDAIKTTSPLVHQVMIQPSSDVRRDVQFQPTDNQHGRVNSICEYHVSIGREPDYGHLGKRNAGSFQNTRCLVGQHRHFGRRYEGGHARLG